MKKRTTRRALVMSLLSLLLCCSMLAGTTFAWFTDSVTSGKNQIIAGNLDVELTHTSASVTAAETVEGETDLFVDENGDPILWEPGVVAWENLTVANLGTLALKYKLSVNFTDVNAVKGTNAKLSEVLKVAVVDPIEATDTREDVLTAVSGKGETLASFVREGKLLPEGSTLQVADASAEPKTYGIVIWWEPSAEDNKWNLQNGVESTDGQPLQIDLGISLVATQQEAEDDSFDETYDKDATYVSAATADELQAAIAKGESVSLTEDITLDAGNFTVAAGTNAVINLGGNDLTLTNADTTAAFLKVEGDLTITGEGNVAARQINTGEGSKLTLGEGVEISTSNSFAINNSGTTVIDGATINHTGTNHAIQNQGNGTLIINDATVTSTSTSNISTINSTGGTVIINGGTFVHEGSMGSVIEWLYSDEGEIIINGGTFIQKGGESLASIDYGSAKLTINGGTFDSASYFAQPRQNIVINAGEFKNNAVVVFNPFMPWTIADKYIPATSTATTNADGSITVTVN